MSERQIDKPIPMPCDFVVKKGSKIWLRSLGANPGPESATVINMLSGANDVELTQNLTDVIGCRIYCFNRI